MPAVGLEPTVSAGEQPQTHCLRPRGHWDRLANLQETQPHTGCMTTHTQPYQEISFSEFTSENRSYSWRNGEAVTGETSSLIFQFKNNRRAFSGERVFHEDSRNQIRLIGVTATSLASLGCRIIVFFLFFSSSAEFSYLERQRQNTLPSERAAEPIIV